MQNIPAARMCVVVTWPNQSVLPITANLRTDAHGIRHRSSVGAPDRHEIFVVSVSGTLQRRRDQTGVEPDRPERWLRGRVQLQSSARDVVVLACSTTVQNRAVCATLAEDATGTWDLQCLDEGGWVAAAFHDGAQVTDWTWCVPGVDCSLRPSQPPRAFRWTRRSIDTLAELAIQPLLSEVGAKVFSASDIVGVGETTHGTAEFGAARLAIAQGAASLGWLRWIAVEANDLDIAELNQFVCGESRDSHKILLDTGWWIHRTREFLDMLLWLRAWNFEHGISERICIVGIDAQGLDSAFRWTIRHPHISLAWRKRASALYRTHRDELRASSSSPMCDCVVEQTGELIASLQFELGSCPLFERISSYVRDCLELRRCASLREQSIVRDAMMARRVAQAQRDLSPSGGLVFAHLAHLQRQDAFGDAATLGGELLRAGVSYSVIGLSALDGEFLAAVPQQNSGFQLQACRLDPLRSPALESSALDRTASFGVWASPEIMTDTTGEPQLYLDPLHHCHSIGAVAISTTPSGSSSITHALRSTDALICVRASTPVALLPSHIGSSYDIPTSSNLESPDIDNARTGELPEHWATPPHRCGNGFECSVQQSLRDGRQVILVRGVSAEQDDAAVICLRSRGAPDLAHVQFSLRARSNDQFAVSVWIRLDTLDRVLLSVSQQRVTPTSDWTFASCAIDIPLDDVVISFGVTTSGEGECELHDLRIQTCWRKTL